MNCSQWIKATHQSECSWNSPQIPFAMEIIGNDDRNHCAAAPILWHGRFIGEEIASISSVLCLPPCDEDHVKMIRMKRLEKAIPALHTIVVQLLSTTGSLKILASKGTRAEKTYQKFIVESSLCETQKDVTLLIQGTQSKHRNATSCDAKQEIIPKNLDKKWTTWKHNFRNQVWSCERHWLVQTPAFGCSSFNCASRKSASSWASSADKF